MNIISSTYLAVAAILIAKNNFVGAASLNPRDEVPNLAHVRYETRSDGKYNHLEARRKRPKNKTGANNVNPENNRNTSDNTGR